MSAFRRYSVAFIKQPILEEREAEKKRKYVKSRRERGKKVTTDMWINGWMEDSGLDTYTLLCIGPNRLQTTPDPISFYTPDAHTHSTRATVDHHSGTRTGRGKLAARWVADRLEPVSLTPPFFTKYYSAGIYTLCISM